MMKRMFFILIAGLFVLGACSSGQQGKALFEANCFQCHSLEKSLKANKSLAEWKKTTKAMVKYANGAITEQDADIIAKYLAKQKPAK